MVVPAFLSGQRVRLTPSENKSTRGSQPTKGSQPGAEPYTLNHNPCAANLRRNVKRFRAGLVFKAHKLVYHATLGLRVTHKRREETLCAVRLHDVPPEGRRRDPGLRLVFGILLFFFIALRPRVERYKSI